MEFKFKENFKLGAASAATQIEGGDLNHSWNDWYRKGKIKDSSDPADAGGHYERWLEDADLLIRMKIPVYRMGIEWARIEPEEGKIDKSAVTHYRKELAYLKKNGIEPLLTIHHFTNPMWFEEKGGFSKAENCKYYLRLVRLAVRSFGDLVSGYITMNEPNVYAVNSWFYGDWPPGGRSFGKTIRTMSVMAACHIHAYKIIHEMRRNMGYTDTLVSFANHLRVFEPVCSRNLWHQFSSTAARWLFQKALTIAMCTGTFYPPLYKPAKIQKGEYCDFIAVNYYTRSTVSGIGDGVRKGAPVNDLGWEIYPEGIVTCIQEAYDILPRPIYITENGTCDNEDRFRARYIAEHLEALTESGLPVERYYHWCFCDNFEWLEGESARFGLVHMDYRTKKRTIKDSGKFYTDMINEHGITRKAFQTYVEGQTYHQE